MTIYSQCSLWYFQVTMHLYALTLQKASTINHAIHGNFSGSKQQEIVISRGKIIELLRPDPNTGKVFPLLAMEMFGVIRDLIAFRLTGGSKGEYLFKFMCSYQVDFFSYYDWQKSWHAPLLFELYSLTFMYLPLSPISVLPVVTKYPLISGNNFSEGMGRLMIINYNIFVYYVEWRVVNHLVWGGVPTICATHCRLVHYFHSLFWIYSCIS